MSWPKAFVRFPDKPKPRDFQRVTVWGFKQKGSYIENGTVIYGPVLAVEACFPDGRSDNYDSLADLAYQNMIIPLKNVVTLNWEAIDFLERTYGITKNWLIEQGIKFYVDGYGANEKY